MSKKQVGWFIYLYFNIIILFFGQCGNRMDGKLCLLLFVYFSISIFRSSSSLSPPSPISPEARDPLHESGDHISCPARSTLLYSLLTPHLMTYAAFSEHLLNIHPHRPHFRRFLTFISFLFGATATKVTKRSFFIL